MRIVYNYPGWEAWQDGKFLAALESAQDVALFLEGFPGEEAVEVLISTEDLHRLLAEQEEG